jgi:hypothetical protein
MPRNSNVERMQKWRRAQQKKRASQDESNKPKTIAVGYKRLQREHKRAVAHASSVESVAVERRDVSTQLSTSAKTVNPGTVQHQTWKDGHQVPVVPMETEQPVNAVVTNWPETAQRPRTSTRASMKLSSEQHVAALTSSEPGPSRPKTRRVVAAEQAQQEHEQGQFNDPCPAVMKEFKLKFIDNKFGFICDVCDRLWSRDYVKQVLSAVVEALAVEFPGRDVNPFKARATFRDSLVKSKIPPLPLSNRFKYPEKTIHEKCVAATMATPLLLMHINHVEFCKSLCMRRQYW